MIQEYTALVTNEQLMQPNCSAELLPFGSAQMAELCSFQAKQ